jgi:3-hydroxyacyl-[acyl-carrier-protein] dehydratase
MTMRYFLIDKVTELEPGRLARGVKNVSLSDEVLHDHFPDYPILPGALILEAASQLAGFLLEMSLNRPGEPLQRALLVQVDLAKFYETSGPGDQVEFTVEMGASRPAGAQVTMQANVGEKRIARATLTFVMKVIPSERVHEQRRYIYKLWTRDFATPVTIL